MNHITRMIDSIVQREVDQVEEALRGRLDTLDLPDTWDYTRYGVEHYQRHRQAQQRKERNYG